MKKTIFLFVLVLILSQCSKQEKCGDIYDKIIRDGRFFFILDAAYSLNVSAQNDNASFIPDNRVSGEVSEVIFNQYSIGEEYCQ